MKMHGQNHIKSKQMFGSKLGQGNGLSKQGFCQPSSISVGVFEDSTLN